MSLTGKLLAATAIVAVASGTALAADVVIIPPPAPAPPPIVERTAFAGPYWGVFGGIGDRGTIGGGGQPAGWVGTQFGYNLVFGNFMTGFEIETEHWLATQTLVDATLNGRFGFILGNMILLYGQAGIGTVFNTPSWSVGGGAEVALGNHLSIFGEIKFYNVLGSPLPFDAWRVVGGVNYYADPSNLGPGGDFDWGGLYFGAHGGAITAPLAGHFGVQVGYNLGGGPFIGGVEVETSHTFGPFPLINAALNGRAGFAFGSVLLYGEVGIGSFIGTAIWTAGGGAELALGNNIGLFAEAKAAFAIGGGGGPIGAIINGGMNIHFGR